MATKTTITRTVDSKGRIALPVEYAKATVIIEKVSDTELRVRKAHIIPEDEIVFLEENRKPLSNRDRDIILDMLANPPKPSAALRKLMRSKK